MVNNVINKVETGHYINISYSHIISYITNGRCGEGNNAGMCVGTCVVAGKVMWCCQDRI